MRVECRLTQRARHLVALAATVLLALAAVGCPPEVGTEAWCKKMDETPKGDWSANEATSYAKHCIFR